MKTKIKIAIALLNLLIVTGIAAQTLDAKAEQLMDRALGKALEKRDLGIRFEGIAYGIKDPKKVFTLPVYKQVRGGYFYMKDDKFEMHLGLVKSISDGKIVVIVDDASHVMFVDSVRVALVTGDTLESISMQKTMSETFGEASMKYEGEETVNAIPCYKIKALMPVSGLGTPHVYYWINKQNGELYLMAEFQNGAYDVYWFSSVGKSPPNYNFEINLPNKEIEDFHGYDVMDNRFVDYHKAVE